jgi:Holliday junction resolvase RusA-like endonuclease
VSLAAAGAVTSALWKIAAAPVHVRMTFNLPRPAGHYGSGKNAGKVRASAPREHVTKPDLDKLARCVLDALTGVVYADDSQVVGINASKCYGAETGCILTISATIAEVAP